MKVLPFRYTRFVTCGLFLGCLLPIRAAAQAQSKNEFLPELDTYVEVSPRFRFLLVARANTDTDSGAVQSQLGANFDLAMRPLLRHRLRTLDPAENKLLVFRAGYWNYTQINGKGPNENRVVLEPTGRFPLPYGFMLSDRNRADLRWISGSPFSWRYRNRLTLARSFTVHHYDLTPYVWSEMYYDSRYSKINRTAYTLGSEFPLSKRTQLDPYLEYQHDTSKPPGTKTIIEGVKLSLFF